MLVKTRGCTLNSEMMIRILVAMLSIGMLAIRIPFVLKARRVPVKTKITEPNWMFWLILLNLPSIVMLICFCAGLKSPIDPIKLSLPMYVRWIGVIFQAIFLGSFYEVHVQLGEFFSPTLELREGHRLIMTGYYQQIRHPLYSIGLTFCLGFIPAMSQLLPGLIILVTLLLFVIWRIPKEEAMMSAEFWGYRLYALKSWRLLEHIW